MSASTQKPYKLADAQADAERVATLTQQAVDALEEAARIASGMERLYTDELSFTFSHAIAATAAGIAHDIDEADSSPKQIAREAREAARLVNLIVTDREA